MIVLHHRLGLPIARLAELVPCPWNITSVIRPSSFVPMWMFVQHDFVTSTRDIFRLGRDLVECTRYCSITGRQTKHLHEHAGIDQRLPRVTVEYDSNFDCFRGAYLN